MAIKTSDDYDHMEVTDDVLGESIGDALNGNTTIRSLIVEAAADSDDLIELMAEGVPLDLDRYNYNHKLTGHQKEQFTAAAVDLYAAIVEYMKELDISNYS